MNTDLEKQKYPVGKYNQPLKVSAKTLNGYISDIERLPSEIRKAVADLSDKQLNTKYREGGWTIRQVVHHIADSHMNAYIRFKLALTEDLPVIKPYYEEKWAELEDGKNMDIEDSLKLIEALHKRWTVLLNSMSVKDFQRKFYHPEHKKEFTLDIVTGIYSWHGKHHCAHITELKKEKGW